MSKRISKAIFCLLIFIIFMIKIFNILNIPFFGYQSFKVISGSMEPAIMVSDKIIVKQQKNYQIGDIITYKSGDEYITHRIIEIDKDKVITKGDANNTNDEPILIEQIIGKVIYNYNINGLSKILEKPLFWVMFFIIGVIITLMIPEAGKHRRKNNEKKKGKHSK